ncbi:MAG: hypothetical protein ACM3Q4_09575 [Acidobacteriota bacterium]
MINNVWIITIVKYGLLQPFKTILGRMAPLRDKLRIFRDRTGGLIAPQGSIAGFA